MLSGLLASFGVSALRPEEVGPPNQALHLTGAATAMSEATGPLQAAPAGELRRWATLRTASLGYALEYMLMTATRDQLSG